MPGALFIEPSAAEQVSAQNSPRGRLDALVAMMRDEAPDVRVGLMFGCPAAYVGRRLAFCTLADTIGVKLPAEEAGRLIASGAARAFRPFGRSAMKQWVELAVEPRSLSVQQARLAPVLASALRYARELA